VREQTAQNMPAKMQNPLILNYVSHNLKIIVNNYEYFIISFLIRIASLAINVNTYISLPCIFPVKKGSSHTIVLRVFVNKINIYS